MKIALQSIVIPLFFTISLGHQAAATPYCPDLLDAASLNSKYKRLAPIYSSMETGWVFASDQLKDGFKLKPQSSVIMNKIIEEFENIGLPFAILIAPPRPVVAGQEILDSTMGSGAYYDVANAAASFEALINRLQAHGAIVPNLQDAALAHSTAVQPFYFHRDTHWTPYGAAISAAALAQSLRNIMPDFFPDASQLSVPELQATGTIEEKGSLANVIRATCPQNPPFEQVGFYEFLTPEPANAADLLGNEIASGPRVALLGSSFSDRYKRDHYRVAQALGAMLQADIDNFSISGGGMIGAIESFLLAATDKNHAYDLIIWEVPYTESFNSFSNLRQLLGAIQYRNTKEIPQTRHPLSQSGKTKLSFGTGIGAGDVLVINAASTELSKIEIRVKFASGKSKRIRLARKKHLPKDRKSDIWAVSLHGIDQSNIIAIDLKYDAQKTGASAVAYLAQSAK